MGMPLFFSLASSCLYSRSASAATCFSGRVTVRLAPAMFSRSWPALRSAASSWMACFSLRIWAFMASIESKPRLRANASLASGVCFSAMACSRMVNLALTPASSSTWKSCG